MVDVPERVATGQADRGDLKTASQEAEPRRNKPPRCAPPAAHLGVENYTSWCASVYLASFRTKSLKNRAVARVKYSKIS